MTGTSSAHRSGRIFYLPHGGGPLPLLGDIRHQQMIEFLQQLTPELGQPSAILVISAHWEADTPTITSTSMPNLIYDYYGFPAQAYTIQYPAPGSPALAETVYHLLRESGIEATLDDQRGFDHGVFVPLKIMYPNARIPCVQLSLVAGLDPALHIRIGQALSSLRKENVLVIGSGFSFHNLKALLSTSAANADLNHADPDNDAFQQWLIETCTDTNISEQQRRTRLIDWGNAPFARYCHPREEHLLPLHVCYGLAGTAASLVFDGQIMAKKTCAFLW